LISGHLKTAAVIADFQLQPIGCAAYLAVNLARSGVSQRVPNGFADQAINGGRSERFEWLGIGGKIELERRLIGA
jgi:cobalamin biosynthesis protein CobT